MNHDHDSDKKSLLKASILFAFILVLGAFLQSYLLFNLDCSWLLHIDKRLLSGGRYWYDFMENNPPLILVFYAPVVWVWQHFPSTFNFPKALIPLFDTYIYLWVAWSYFSCYYLLVNKKPSKMASMPCSDPALAFNSVLSSPTMTLTLLGAIAVALLLLPGFSLGQREHCFVLLILPYLCLGLRRRLPLACQPLFALMVGLAAGIGFCIKPHFLMTFLLLEASFYYDLRGRYRLIRIETIAVMFVLLSYCVFMVVVTPDYLFNVVPWVFQLYLPVFNASLVTLTLPMRVQYALVCVLLYFLTQAHLPDQALRRTLLAALVGGGLAYYFQGGITYYHQYPFFAFGFILNAVVLVGLLHYQGGTKDADAGRVDANAKKIVVKAHERLFFYSNKKRWLSVILAVGLLAVSALCYGLFYKFFIFESQTEASVAMIKELDKRAGDGTVYQFSTAINPVYPAIDYDHFRVDSRYGNFWPLPTIILHLKSTDPHVRAQAEIKKQQLMQQVLADLRAHPPRVLLFDARDFKLYFKNKQFNFYKFFAQEPAIAAIFKHYHYVTTVHGFRFYIRNQHLLR